MKTIKYSLWTVLDENKILVGNRIYLKCKCKCGTIKNVIIKNLKSGISTSCGCIRSRKLIKRNFKHGKRFTKTWRAWQAMKNRCYNKNQPYYRRYGGRGITVCDAWKNDFMAFYKDVGDPPKGLSLDRIDNNGNYEPNNVRWATVKQQANNKENNRKINGVFITKISKKLGGKHQLVGQRLRRGWTVEKAISIKSNAIPNTKNRTIKI